MALGIEAVGLAERIGIGRSDIQQIGEGVLVAVLDIFALDVNIAGHIQFETATEVIAANRVAAGENLSGPLAGPCDADVVAAFELAA